MCHEKAPGVPPISELDVYLPINFPITNEAMKGVRNQRRIRNISVEKKRSQGNIVELSLTIT